MRHARPFVALAVAFLLLGLLPSPAAALSYRGMSVAELTVAADFVAVGTFAPTENPRPGDRPAKWPATRRFTIDRALKGDAFAAGAAVDVPQNWMDGPIHQDAGEVRAVVWLWAKGGEVGLINFNNAVKDATPALVRQVESVVAVAADPKRFLDTVDPAEVEAACYWARYAWHRVGWWVPPRPDRADAAAVKGVARDEAVRFLIRIATSPASAHRTLAVEVLADFKSPAAYDALVAALAYQPRERRGTRDDEDAHFRDLGRVAAAARGLGELGDRRAVPALIAALRAVGLDNDQAGQSICAALGALGDRAAVPVLLERLKSRTRTGAAEALAKIRDPAALPALLEALWADGYGIDEVLAFDDPSVLAQAWERAHDHPAAPVILAAHGDPRAKPLMLTLIRQLNPVGVTWAAKTNDPESVAAVVEAMRRAGDTQFLMNAMPVADRSPGPRATGSIARLLASSGYGAYALHTIERRLGMPAQPPFSHELYRQPEWDARTRRAYAAALAAADVFELDPATRAWFDQALRQTPDVEAVYGLPPMPHGDGVAAVRAYIDRRGPTIRALVMDARVPAAARSQWTYSLGSAGSTLLDRADLRALLANPEQDLKVAALAELRRRKLEPDADEVRSLFGTRALEAWLYAVAQDNRCACPEVLRELVEADWAVSAHPLHAAVRAVKPPGVAPALRARLAGNAIDARRAAATTLAHLGDDAGRAVIEQELRRFEGQRSSFDGWPDEARKALKAIDAR